MTVDPETPEAEELRSWWSSEGSTATITPLSQVGAYVGVHEAVAAPSMMGPMETRGCVALREGHAPCLPACGDICLPWIHLITCVCHAVSCYGVL